MKRDVNLPDHPVEIEKRLVGIPALGLIRTTPYLTSSRVNGLAAGHGSFAANFNAFGF